MIACNSCGVVYNMDQAGVEGRDIEWCKVCDYRGDHQPGNWDEEYGPWWVVLE